MSYPKFFNPEMETLSRPQIEKLQLERLHDTVQCCMNSPFYKERFSHIGLKPSDIKGLDDIQKIPFTTKQDLMILEFLELLAEYNNGDPEGVKAKLDNLVQEKSIVPYQQYETTYKNNLLKYLLGLEDNMIKAVCIEQNLTYQQLADILGLSESSLRSAASTNKISKQVEKSIEMYLKIVHLEKELEKANAIKTTLKLWLN